MQTTINGIELHQLFSAGYRNLKKNMEEINDLNVFPVPDGDTGANMVMTFGGGFNAADPNTAHVGDYMKTLSKATLLSARGNSGVIFSQFIHGLYRGLADKETICVADLAKAFVCAKEDSYNSILTPTEGTILTVIREAAEFLAACPGKYTEFVDGFAALLAKMKATLRRTPEMLPVLKEAGVVDSGGAGLVCFVEGMYAHLRGEEIEDTPDLAGITNFVAGAENFGPDSHLEYGYCTEFILQLMNYKTDIDAFDVKAFTKRLEELGDSIVAVKSDSIVKIHVHTFTPDEVLAYGRQFGEFVTVKIENMSVQHSEVEATAEKQEKEKVKYAVVAVASGEGIVDYFYSIGATAVVDGGQTSNPSVSAFLDAFSKFDAEHIIVLPNNSNVILTAKQAAEAYQDCDVHVIPTKSVVEGYSALSMMNPWCDTVEEFIEEMSMSLPGVTTGYVTTAIRDAYMDGVDVKKGDYIGLADHHILTDNADRISAAKTVIKKITDESEKGVIIVFYGAEVPDEEAAALEEYLHSTYPMVDIGFVNGKQSVYDYIISLE